VFNFDITALESTSIRNLTLNTYPYLDICFDIDTIHMTADVKKEGISLKTYFIGVRFRVADIKNERKLVYEIQFV
jgi:hypothetical protein